MWRKAVVVVAVCLVAGADKKDSDLKKAQGSWVLVSGQAEGNKFSDEQVKATSLLMEGKNFTLKLGDEPIKGTVKLDSTKTPKTLDSTRTEGGEILLGIYEMKGDEFKVCLAAAGKERPKDFTSGDYLYVWKRAKKSDK